jgi:hypothetical protein
MLPLPPAQREAIAVGILALSQRAADLRHLAATLTGEEHTAATREALVVETLVTALDSYVSAYVTPADATADTERPAPPPARDTERDAKFPSAAPAVATGEGGSPTAT